MKPLSTFFSLAVLLALCTRAQAQHTFEAYNGGDGIWDAGHTADWNTNQTYVNSISRDGTVSPEVSITYFGSTPGKVTIDDSKSSTNVTTGFMEFNSGSQAGNWFIQGGTLDNVEADYTATVLQIDGGQTANVTVSSTINIAPNPTNNSSVFYNGGNGTTLTLGNLNISNTPITFTDSTGPHTEGAPYTYNGGTVSGQTPLLFGVNGTTTILNGNVTTDSGLTGFLVFGNYGDSNEASATYVINGALNYTRNSYKEFDFGSGNIVLNTSQTGTGAMTFVGNGAGLLQTLLTKGAQTINNDVNQQSTSNAEVGGSDASASVYNGLITAGSAGGQLDLHASDNGTVTFNGDIGGNDQATTKSGNGTVILAHSTGNDFTSTTAFEMKQGTTLIMNKSGFAFGGASGSVKLDSGATLGGTGTTGFSQQTIGSNLVENGQTVVAQAADSVIAPGTATTIGTLTLGAGLTADNGVTLDFKLNGAASNAYDTINFSQSDLSIGGDLTFNFSNLGGALSTDTDYTIMTGIGEDNLNPDSIEFNAPTGYTVSEAEADDGVGTFSVQFEAVAAPEPSTYGMLGLGLLGLVGFARWLRLSRAA